FGKAAVNNPEQGFYLLLEQYPGAPLAIAAATFLGLMFYVTSADSGALVMSNFTSKVTSSDGDGPPWMRIFWSVATGVLTLALFSFAGLVLLNLLTFIIAYRFQLVFYLFCFILLTHFNH